ncbi:MAG: hypothetical protein K0R38_4951 [Polyangiaceae bacterium]|nr:hypothetical protein [Polyangiaceae bacterium]
MAAAEDALGVTYLKAVERFEQFQWQAVGIYPWLRVVALNVALDQLRRGKREAFFRPEDLERELDASAGTSQGAPESEIADLAFARQRVTEVLDRINPRYAQALRLRILEEVPREACAAALSVSPATFDVVLHRAVAALKKELARAPS